MLYITIGAAIVYIMGLFGATGLYDVLCFDKTKILQGQVWRLFTYVFTHAPGTDIFFVLIFLYFFYNLSHRIETSMGTFRFNLFYFTGMILMDVFALVFCPTEAVLFGRYIVYPADFTNFIYSGMAFYLHLSILLMFASTNPNSHFLVFFIIPVKAWFMGLVYLLLIAVEIYQLSAPVILFPHNLFPLVGLLNYLIFAGKDVKNLFPFLENRPRYSATRRQYQTPIPFRQKESAPVQKQEKAYSHKCTICGRTDVTNPELEFRYCSRCNGYHCYCEDHINNHTHVE